VIVRLLSSFHMRPSPNPLPGGELSFSIMDDDAQPGPPMNRSTVRLAVQRSNRPTAASHAANQSVEEH
jgi:hypothetical protein